MKKIRRNGLKRGAVVILWFVMMFSVLNWSTNVYAVQQSEVSNKLSILINQYNKTYWTTNGLASDTKGSTSKYYYGIQCKGFANYVFSQVFGVKHIGAYNETYIYYITNPVGAVEVGRNYGFSSTDTTTVKNLLSKGMPGDFIQVKRRNNTYGHSMILVNKDNNGITVFDCNSDGKCGIRNYYITWDSLHQII